MKNFLNKECKRVPPEKVLLDFLFLLVELDFFFNFCNFRWITCLETTRWRCRTWWGMVHGTHEGYTIGDHLYRRLLCTRERSSVPQGSVWWIRNPPTQTFSWGPLLVDQIGMIGSQINGQIMSNQSQLHTLTHPL